MFYALLDSGFSFQKYNDSTKLYEFVAYTESEKNNPLERLQRVMQENATVGLDASGLYNGKSGQFSPYWNEYLKGAK